MKLRPLLVTCVLLALASAALGRQAAAPSAAATARITKEVRHELVMLPYFTYSTISPTKWTDTT